MDKGTLIEILGIPVPLQRHRSFRSYGKIIQYDPQIKEKLEFVKKIRQILIDPVQIEKLLQKISYEVTIVFCMPYPKSKLRKVMPLLCDIPHICKPDIDNLIKYVLDCGNGLLWSDDKKIIKITCKKVYAEEPKTVILID